MGDCRMRWEPDISIIGVNWAICYPSYRWKDDTISNPIQYTAKNVWIECILCGTTWRGTIFLSTAWLRRGVWINISSSFNELCNEKDFFDGTLACDDEQIQAHKLIILAWSPFFPNVYATAAYHVSRIQGNVYNVTLFVNKLYFVSFVDRDCSVFSRNLKAQLF